MTEYLDLESILVLAEDALEGEPLVRDLGLLHAAVARPAATAFGVDIYPTAHTKAAALLHSLVRNHALVDGNKRLGWHAMVVFLDLNGHVLNPPDDDAAVDFVVAVAEGTLNDVEKIAERLAEWTA